MICFPSFSAIVKKSGLPITEDMTSAYFDGSMGGMPGAPGAAAAAAAGVAAAVAAFDAPPSPPAPAAPPPPSRLACSDCVIDANAGLLAMDSAISRMLGSLSTDERAEKSKAAPPPPPGAAIVERLTERKTKRKARERERSGEKNCGKKG